jgi:trk system potassium uptake protein TrkH
MPLYDSILHTFSTISTGGYSLKNASIGAYHNPVIEVIVTIFMFIGATNFVLLYWLSRGNVKRLLRSSEFKFYFFLNLIAVLLVTLQTRSTIYPSFLEALRYSSFNVMSISTTTGYATANFDLWPPFSKWLLLILMFFGACAGSTGGAIKNIRIVVLFKRCYQEIHRLIHPRAVVPVRVDRKPVSQEVLSSITGFFLLYLLVFLVASLLVMAQENLPIITAISACATTMGNVGPGLGEVGPAGNFSNLSDFTKVILSILMLLGRLELFTVLVLFTPVFWRK